MKFTMLPEGFNREDFFDFKFFIMPLIIKFVWELVSVLVGLAVVVSGFGMMRSSFIGGFLIVVCGTPLALLVVRLWFELIMGMFAMIALLREIRDKNA